MISNLKCPILLLQMGVLNEDCLYASMFESLSSFPFIYNLRPVLEAGVTSELRIPS